MKRSTSRWIAPLCTYALVAGCWVQDDTPPQDPTDGGTAGATDTSADSTGEAAGAAIGPEGGEVSSPDGMVTLVVPAGALTEVIEFSIEPQAEARPGAVLPVYEIAPSGTEFAIPATVSFSFSEADLGGRLPGELRPITYEGDQPVMLDGVTLDRESMEVSALTPHLSEFTCTAVDLPVSLAGVHWYQWALAEDVPSLVASCDGERRANRQCGWNVESVAHVGQAWHLTEALEGARRARDAGLTTIVRIDWAGGQVVPTNPDDYEQWRTRFYEHVDAFLTEGLARRFIVGNEPPIEADGSISAAEYLDAFAEIYEAKGDRDIEILAAGPNSWVPSDWFDAMLAGLGAADGFALHAYHDPTRCANNPGVEDEANPGTEQCCDTAVFETNDEGESVKVCHYQAGNWPFDGGFGYLRYQLRSMARHGQGTKPVYVTEFNSNWTPSDNYRDGIVQGAFRSVRDYLHQCDETGLPQVRALVWFVDAPNPARDPQQNSDWMGFALSNGDSDALGNARNELIAEFENPANGGTARACEPPPPAVCSFCSDVTDCDGVIDPDDSTPMCVSGQCVFGCSPGDEHSVLECDAGLWRWPDGDAFGVCECTPTGRGDGSGSPDSPEAGDGVDNDCDGAIDEGWCDDTPGWHAIYRDPGQGSSCECAIRCDGDADCPAGLSCLDPGMPGRSRCSYDEPCVPHPVSGDLSCQGGAMNCEWLGETIGYECTPIINNSCV